MIPALEIRRTTQYSPFTYEALDRYQRKLAEEILLHSRPGTVLLSEVAPVITLGKRACVKEALLTSEEELQATGVQILSTDRGGLATYHGPGQWVVFPVDRLERLTGDPRGVRKTVEGLLSVACSVARHYVPDAHIREGAELGVWTSHGKVASIGIQIARGVLLHGLSLNGYRTSTSFKGIRPCGLAPQVDFLLEHSLAGAPSLEAAFEELGQRLADDVLNYFWK